MDRTDPGLPVTLSEEPDGVAAELGCSVRRNSVPLREPWSSRNRDRKLFKPGRFCGLFLTLVAAFVLGSGRFRVGVIRDWSAVAASSCIIELLRPVLRWKSCYR